MATAKSPGRKKRDHEYPGNPGVVGRQTGLTLAERQRDEHGLEDPEHLFSPTPGRPTAGPSNGTLDSSEEMEIASSGQEPASYRPSRPKPSGKEILAYGRPLPHMRSPLKSSLGGTPRRGSSIGVSSPAVQAQRLQKPPPPIQRALDFSGGQSSNVPFSPANPALGSSSSRTTRRENVYDLPLSEHDDNANVDAGIDEDDEVGMSYALDGQDDLDVEQDGLETIEYTNGQDEEEGHMGEEQQVDEEVVAEPETQPPKSKRKRGRPSKESRQEELPVVVEDVEEAAEQRPPPRPRGRPPKTVRAATAPLAQKNPNARLKDKKTTKNAKGKAQAPPTNQRIRYQTPMEDDEVSTSRAGRHIYKPLSYWKGEHAIFEDHTRNTSLKEIIRVDEATPVKRRTYARTKSHKKKRTHSVFEADLDDDGYEPWETADDGIVVAPVKLWDQEQGNAPADDEADQTLAFAASRITPQAGADNPGFMFTKTLTMPFFGSGLIELPPGGMKGQKNSRKFQFVFFVYTGKVAVEIEGTRFVISRGGMWQVPRGNFYSITNESDHTAKVFFAQACEMPAQTKLSSLHSDD